MPHPIPLKYLDEKIKDAALAEHIIRAVRGSRSLRKKSIPRKSCMPAALQVLSAVAVDVLIRGAVFDVIRRHQAGAEVKNSLALTLALVLGGVATLWLSSAALGQSPFPEAPARDTVFLACSQCHSIGKMVQADLTADDWQFVVYDMIARGAPVPGDDVDDVVRYLQDSFASDGN